MVIRPPCLRKTAAIARSASDWLLMPDILAAPYDNATSAISANPAANSTVASLGLWLRHQGGSGAAGLAGRVCEARSRSAANGTVASLGLWLRHQGGSGAAGLAGRAREARSRSAANSTVASLGLWMRHQGGSGAAGVGGAAG